MRGRLEAGLRVAAGWHEATSVDDLVRTACTDLAGLIAADAVGWSEIDVRSGAIRIFALPEGLTPDHEDMLSELLYENPLLEHRADTYCTARTFSDFLSVSEYHRRQIYCDVYRHYEVEEQMAAWFGVGKDGLIAVALNRTRRSFTGDDRMLLDLLLPHIEGAFRTVDERGAVRHRIEALELAFEARHTGVVILTRTGSVDYASSLHGRWFAPGRVPAPGTYSRDNAELTVRSVGREPRVLLLDECLLRPEAETVRRLGLTPREAEVVALAGRGHSNAEIADRLVLAERTVHKHLEHAYEKLGVHSRAAAGRLLFEA